MESRWLNKIKIEGAVPGARLPALLCVASRCFALLPCLLPCFPLKSFKSSTRQSLARLVLTSATKPDWLERANRGEEGRERSRDETREATRRECCGEERGAKSGCERKVSSLECGLGGLGRPALPCLAWSGEVWLVFGSASTGRAQLLV